MKFAFNVKIAKNSWGGGNAFLKIFTKFLKEKGHKVLFNLNDLDIDVIFIIDPRYNNPFITFPIAKAINYTLFKNNKTLIIHRINECNKKRFKSNLNIDNLLLKTNQFADYTIFVSKWLSKQRIWKNKNKKDSRVILNGSDKSIFNTKGKKNKKKNQKLSLVTHHWSNNWNKGFKYYKILDNLLDKPYWKSRVKFSFLGNIPQHLQFKNTNVLKPLNDHKLSKKLKEFDGYITGSMYEPGSNHQNEGALCGLPLFYIDHSSMPEYCETYGVSFKEKNFEKQLKLFKKKLPFYQKKIKKFKHNSDLVCKNYLDLINDISQKKIKRSDNFSLLIYIFFIFDFVKYNLKKILFKI
tara:strand:+ start:822 stop:1877 length:1056 start_codon:yes stop_codon:yes gene_type:complete